MKKGNYRVVLSIFFLSGLLALTGCPDETVGVYGKVTGGGSIQSESGVKEASFGFNADNCAQHRVGMGRFNYHDKYATIQGKVIPGGVKMNGHITIACKCETVTEPKPSDCDCNYVIDKGLAGSWYQLTLHYISTNPKHPKDKHVEKTGIAEVCVQDNGEGTNAVADLAYIRVNTGPYAGYELEGGRLVQGNIQSHECDDE